MAFPRSGTVDTQTFSGTKDFVSGRMAAVQNANIGVGDHLKFDTVDAARPVISGGAGALSSSAVALDTSSTYANTVGTASIGRVTLKGGKTYRISVSFGYVLFSGATGVLTLQLADVTSGSAVFFGSPLQLLPMTQTSNDNADSTLFGIYTAGGSQSDSFLVEVQITAVTALTSIGSTTKGQPVIFVETI